MADPDLKRLSRLTAIITRLQSRRVVTSTELAEKFGVSVRTIYRDIRALEEAGIPVVAHEGKGYSLMDGYRIPPVMFTENEANALITAEKLVLKNKDISLIRAYQEAIAKIKSVLSDTEKDKANLLSSRILVQPAVNHPDSSNVLTQIQMALTGFRIVSIRYHSITKDEETTREIEPFAIYNNTLENWNLIAFCRLRQDYRVFRLDKILDIKVTERLFEPHSITIEQYVEMQRKKYVNP